MDNWMPDKLKATLRYGAVSEDITHDITNWNELMTNMQRDGISGVFLSVDMPIKVARRARTILRDLFFTSFLNASATIEIHKRSAFDLDTYTLIYSAKLDFSTFTEQADHVEIGSTVRDFNSLVKSVGKTKYDIPVEELPTENWRYEHNEVMGGGYYTVAEAAQLMIGETEPETSRLQTLSINLDKSEIPFGGRENDFRSEYLNSTRSSEDIPPGRIQRELPPEYFFKAGPGGAMFQLSFKFRIRWQAVNSGWVQKRFLLHFRTAEGQDMNLLDIPMPATPASPITDQNWVDLDFNQRLSLNSDEELRMMFYSVSPESDQDIIIENFDHFWIKYTDKSQLTTNIPIVSAQTFVNALLDKMSDNDPARKYTATIDEDTDNPWPFNHYLIAAESIRDLDKPTFHANFNDFLLYMQFLGYEWEVDEATLVVAFRKRNIFFDPTTTALDLTEAEVAKLTIKASDEYAYSTVRIGYEKPDIESINGRFAVCGAFDYSTGYANAGDSDSALEIMCPYKADPVEIETLTWTRGEKTTDQKTDNDIFMLAGEITGENVIETRQAEYVVADQDIDDPISWYNVPYIPCFIARRNGSKIAIAVQNLTFTGTDAYRGAQLAGVVTGDIYSDIVLPPALFSPVTYDFEAGTYQNLPAQRYGLVNFLWKGETYRGFIEKLVKAHNGEMPNTRTLLGYSQNHKISQ